MQSALAVAVQVAHLLNQVAAVVQVGIPLAGLGLQILAP
jgi:hypothetical protein